MARSSKKKKVSLSRRFRRWKRRFVRRHPTFTAVVEGVLGFLVVAAVLCAVLMLVSPKARDVILPAPTPAPTASPTPEPTASPSPTPVPTATPEPTPSPTPSPSPSPTPKLVVGVEESLYYQQAKAGAEYSDPAQNGLLKTKIYAEGEKVATYSRFDEIKLPPSAEYLPLSTVYSDS